LQPASGSTVVESFTVSFSLPEDAISGSVQLRFKRIGGSADSAGERVVSLTSGFETAGTHTFTIGRLSTAPTLQPSEITRVSPAVDLVHMAVYNVTVEYSDLIANPVAKSTNHDITYDVFTEDLQFIKPATLSAINTTFDAQLLLGEDALSGSVKMTISYVSGITDNAANRVIVLGSLLESAGPHQFEMEALSTAADNLAEVQSVTPDVDLVDGATYDFLLEYSDAHSNSKQTRAQANVLFVGDETITPTLTLPASATKVPEEFQLTFSLPERAFSGSVKLSFVHTGGQSDPAPSRVVTFASNVESVGPHSLSLPSLQSAAVLVSSVSTVTPATNLVDGAIYDVTLSYSDLGPNEASTAVNTGVEFDTSTEQPSILKPQAGRVKVDFDLQIVVPEDALPDSLALTITTISGDLVTSSRLLKFDPSLDDAGTYSMSITNLSKTVDAEAQIASISPDVDLVHMAQYVFTLALRDSVGNDAASSPAVAITFDTFTETPTLHLPAASSVFKRAFFFDFEIPEDALSGSLQVTFAPTNAAGTSTDNANARIITFSSDLEAAGRHSPTSPMVSFSNAAGSLAFISAITPSTDLVHMAQYDVTLSYRDVAENEAATVTHASITFDDFTETPILSGPATGSYIKTAFTCQFDLPETAASGSVRIIISTLSTEPRVDSTTKRTVVLHSSLEGAFTHFFNFGALTTAKDDVAEIVSVSPEADLIDGVAYEFQLEYQDLALNEKALSGINTVKYAGDATLTPGFSGQRDPSLSTLRWIIFYSKMRSLVASR
jgi:hypothetical protein